MKWILILVFMSASAYSFEIPFEIRGEYKFSGEIEHVQTSIRELVHSHTSVGAKRLKELQADKYTCVHKGRSLFSCTKFDKSVIPTPELLAEMSAKHAAQYVSFYEPRLVPELTHRSDSYKEYRFHQSLKVNTQVYRWFRYRILKSGIHKIKAGPEGSMGKYFVVKSGGDLVQIENLFRGRGKVRYRFLLNIHYSND